MLYKKESINRKMKCENTMNKKERLAYKRKKTIKDVKGERAYHFGL